jgi:sensor domain CHASE-containing protein
LSYNSRLLTHWLVPSATVVGLATLALLAAFVLVNANKQDQLAEQRSIAGMQLGLDHALAAVSRTAGDYATGWTEAYVNLVLEPDAEWADRNVGHHIPSTFGPELTFVLGPDGTTTYAAVDGIRTTRPVEDYLGPELAALVEAAALVDIDEAAPVEGFMRAGEVVALVGVAPILPDAADGLEKPPPPL